MSRQRGDRRVFFEPARSRGGAWVLGARPRAVGRATVTDASASRVEMKRLAKAGVLIIDDFGLEPLGAAQRKDQLEVIEDRDQVSATRVTSQLEPKDWHALIGEPTIADAICDRLVHNAHRLKLSGDSMRGTAGLTAPKKPAK